jgi:hypothetical protein
MPTPILLGGQEFIYFNEHTIKKNDKISGKGAISNDRNECNKRNESIYKIIIQYIFYTIMLLNLALLYLIFDEINRKKMNYQFKI